MSEPTCRKRPGCFLRDGHRGAHRTANPRWSANEPRTEAEAAAPPQSSDTPHCGAHEAFFRGCQECERVEYESRMAQFSDTEGPQGDFDALWTEVAEMAAARGLVLEEVTRGWGGHGYLAATLNEATDWRDVDAAGDTPTAALKNLRAALASRPSEEGAGE